MDLPTEVSSVTSSLLRWVEQECSLTVSGTWRHLKFPLADLLNSNLAWAQRGQCLAIACLRVHPTIRKNYRRSNVRVSADPAYAHHMAELHRLRMRRSVPLAQPPLHRLVPGGHFPPPAGPSHLVCISKVFWDEKISWIKNSG